MQERVQPETATAIVFDGAEGVGGAKVVAHAAGENVEYVILPELVLKAPTL